LSMRVERTIPYVLALVVVVTSMRGLEPVGFKCPDAARHAMNGAFIYDLVRTGNFAHPITYGKQFYSRFPAISLPFHPPLFPAIEALFYAAFGVNFFAARLPVALATGVCALLLYRLVNRSHQSVWLAIAATMTFITMSTSQMVATDVMLEFPSLAFTMGALYCLRDLETSYPPSRAYPFALLAGAAVWTKQHAVFLGLVPFIFILLQGNWRLLRGLHLWGSSLLFGLMVLALTMLSVPAKHIGVASEFVAVHEFWGAGVVNARFYGRELRQDLGLVVTCWLLFSAGAFLAIPRLRRRPENHLYLAWLLAMLPLLLLTAKHDLRYLLFGLPALVVLGYDGLRLACKRVLPVRYVPAVTGLLAVFLILHQTSRSLELRAETAYMVPIQLARTIKDRVSRRLIYCGDNVGYLAVGMRFLDPDSRTIMIRGDKLDPAIFTPEGFEHFAWRYGVDTVVLEPGRKHHPWDFLVASPSPSMVRERVISDPKDTQHEILIFDFTNPSSQPESSLDIPIMSRGPSLNLSL